MTNEKREKEEKYGQKKKIKKKKKSKISSCPSFFFLDPWAVTVDVIRKCFVTVPSNLRIRLLLMDKQRVII